MTSSRQISAVLVTIFLASAAVTAGDWRQWRGPNLNGSTDETNLPTDLTKAANTAWTTSLPGPAGSTPIVVGKRIFLTSTRARLDNLMAMCVSATDGKVLWSKTLSSGKPPSRIGAIAGSSPVSDGKWVYFLFGSGDLVATDLAGEIQWTRNLARDYGPFAIRFGYSATPLLREGKLYIPLLRTEKPWPTTVGKDLPHATPLKSLILCLAAETGKTTWAHVRDTDAKSDCRDTYITPMAVTVKGRTELIMCGGEYVTGHEIETGKELWRWEYTTTREIWQRIVASPVVVDGLVLVSQAHGRGMFALKPGLQGTVPHDKAVWLWEGDDAGAADCCSPLVYRGNVYVIAGDKRKGKALTCMEPKTGKIKWRQEFKAAGPWRASPTGADGKIYCISEGGDVVVLAAGDEYKELFRGSLKVKPCRSTIVAANGQLLVRTAKDLICLRKP